MEGRSQQSKLASKRSRTLTFATTHLMRKSLAYKALVSRGWTEVREDEEWDLFWADVYAVGPDSGFSMAKLKPHQRLNHFQRHTELTRKDALVKNLKRARRASERESGSSGGFDILPQTYVLPQEYSMFADEFRKEPGHIWIMKPSAKSQGEGIFLVNRISHVYAWRKEQDAKPQPDSYVISRYIERPLLIGGRKFDLRLYVLVTSLSPLQIFIYRGGFCRFSSGLYSPDNLDDLKMHLTNVALQKRQAGIDPSCGTKWPLSSLPWEFWKMLQDVVVHSLLATQHVITADKRCFEVFGYDILLDQDLKPWLIEVNASPSLSANTAADFKLKLRLIEDTLTILEPQEHDLPTGQSAACSFDLIWLGREGIKPHPVLQSLLGCSIPGSTTPS